MATQSSDPSATPKKVTVGGNTVEQHGLKDRLEYDRHQSADTEAKKRSFGLRLGRFSHRRGGPMTTTTKSLRERAAKHKPRMRLQGGRLVPVRGDLRAAYSAASNDDNGRMNSLFFGADGLSADDANSLDVRRRLRERARFECLENNPYGVGIVQTYANDVIGNG